MAGLGNGGVRRLGRPGTDWSKHHWPWAIIADDRTGMYGLAGLGRNLCLCFKGGLLRRVNGLRSVHAVVGRRSSNGNTMRQSWIPIDGKWISG